MKNHILEQRRNDFHYQTEDHRSCESNGKSVKREPDFFSGFVVFTIAIVFHLLRILFTDVIGRLSVEP